VGGRSLTVAQRATLEQGAGIFRESCSSCHGQTGLGAPVPGGTGTVAPALAGSPRVTGHPDYALNVLLHGLTGPIEGKTYAGQIMVSQAQQTNEWIAAIASYIRSTMTNNASFVTPEQVAAVRARTAARTTAWTYPELAAVVPQLMQQQSTWKATASHEPDRAVRGFGTAGWSTVVPQQPGMWFQFELPEPTTLAELRFLSAPGFTPQGQPPRPATYPRGYKVQLSMDGTTWSEPLQVNAITTSHQTEPAVAMDDQRSLDRPAPIRLGLDSLERGLGHAGIVLEGERVDSVAMVALAHVHLAHQPDEYRQPADPLVAGAQAIELGADVEIRLLDAHGHGINRR